MASQSPKKDPRHPPRPGYLGIRSLEDAKLEVASQILQWIMPHVRGHLRRSEIQRLVTKLCRGKLHDLSDYLELIRYLHELAQYRGTPAAYSDLEEFDKELERTFRQIIPNNNIASRLLKAIGPRLTANTDQLEGARRTLDLVRMLYDRKAVRGLAKLFELTHGVRFSLQAMQTNGPRPRDSDARR